MSSNWESFPVDDGRAFEMIVNESASENLDIEMLETIREVLCGELDMARFSTILSVFNPDPFVSSKAFGKLTAMKGPCDAILKEIEKATKDKTEIESTVLEEQPNKNALLQRRLAFEFNVPRKRRWQRRKKIKVPTGIEVFYGSSETERRVEQNPSEISGEERGKNLQSSSRGSRGRSAETLNDMHSKKKMRFSEKVILRTQADVPEYLRNRIIAMNGSKPILVIQRRLTSSDLNEKLGRMSIPKNQVLSEFLLDDETEKLDCRQGIQVNLIDPRLEENSLVLKKWNMGATFLYALIQDWNVVVENNREVFKVEDNPHAAVQLWSFRCDSKLWFALNVVDDQQQTQA